MTNAKGRFSYLHASENGMYDANWEVWEDDETGGGIVAAYTYSEETAKRIADALNNESRPPQALEAARVAAAKAALEKIARRRKFQLEVDDAYDFQAIASAALSAIRSPATGEVTPEEGDEHHTATSMRYMGPEEFEALGGGLLA